MNELPAKVIEDNNFIKDKNITLQKKNPTGRGLVNNDNDNGNAKIFTNYKGYKNSPEPKGNKPSCPNNYFDL